MIQINEQLFIPDEEITFTMSRSSGPGGQNVNKVETRVTLWFDVANSPSLSDEQKQRLAFKLSTRINRQGRLWVVAKEQRSQLANREIALARFVALLQQALAPDPVRRRVRMPAAVKAARQQNKRHRSQVKKQRQKVHDWESSHD